MLTLPILAIICFLTGCLYVPAYGCDLKASEKTFLDEFDVPWSCRIYCPGIRGCFDKCCPSKEEELETTKNSGVWPVLVPLIFVLVYMLLFTGIAAWISLKHRMGNSKDLEGQGEAANLAQGGVEDPVQVEAPGPANANRNLNEEFVSLPSGRIAQESEIQEPSKGIKESTL